MFEHVLVAEDHEIANLSLRRTLEGLHIPSPDHAHYCDQALSKVKKALQNGQPYDLLVTDLYFEADGSAQQLPEGVELIRAARTLQPNLRVLVFSAESSPPVIRSLFEELNIDGYVRKARGDAQELKTAIAHLAQNRRHHPRELRTQPAQENLHVFSELDTAIIRLLAKGTAQKDIPAFLNALGLHPSSLSSVEKRLNLIKTAMDFKKNEQLVAFCTELKII
ncbi:response regulator [Mucilaginibacter ginsenosidivorans]|uniref:Response regulator transcription factor n=1 Tax=Mucilaginibacter ginsenosidivorans TaxID=398053 RepID=A0A5B8UUD5_9SPHI|nr:response regulator [Mucilaginibacter ginsenosidivorans]QEC62498.1 response regulator transcription factor [Mucilaginibacter ginsenosidivorans]